jgi:hypothetical protein
MPGHMNVLLAEADVPYEQLFELERINGDFKNTDVVIVVGANDVVNPIAREPVASPISGMPILDVDYATTVVVIKRSPEPGLRGHQEPALRGGQLPDALRRREEGAHRDGRRGQGALSHPGRRISRQRLGTEARRSAECENARAGP